MVGPRSLWTPWPYGDWFAEKEPGLLFAEEKGAPFRRTTFGRKWAKARAKAGLPEDFRFYDLRHTGHTLSTQSGATLKGTMVRAGQSSEKAAMIYQHSDDERQQEVAGASTPGYALPASRER